MDKRMVLLGKIGTILADFVGIIVMLMALAFAFAREKPVIFVVLAAVVCPLWYKVIQKYWLREKPVVSALIRAVILVGCYLLLTQAIKWNPYTRCYDSVARKSFQQFFEETNADQGYTFEEVGDIARKEMWDYLKLTADVSYKDSDGQPGSQELSMYYDRLDGRFYEDFEALRSYRKEYREAYKTNSFRDRQFFDDEQLDLQIEDLSAYLVENQYDAMTEALDSDLQKEVTEEIWEGWQDQMAALGTFQGMELPVEKNWLVTEDQDHVQTMEVTVTLTFTGGSINVFMVFHDDLTLQSIELQ